MRRRAGGSERQLTKKETIIVLFSITLCWSMTYIIIKDIPEGFSDYAYLTLTSGLAGLLLALLFRRVLSTLNKKTLLHGFILAVLITGNMLFEKLGLEHLEASAASVFASMNIVFVPLILVLLKKYPSRNNVAGIIIILAGILVSRQATFEGSGLTGMIFMLASCAMMSVYTVVATYFTRESDPILLTILQLCITAVIAFGLWVITDPGSLMKIEWSKKAVSYILIIALFSKAYAYLMLMFAEKYADALSITIVASMEPVVTLTLAIIIPASMGGGESFSATSIIGAVIITLGAIVAGTNFLSRKKVTQECDPQENDVRESFQYSDNTASANSEITVDDTSLNSNVGESALSRKQYVLRYIFITVATAAVFAALWGSINLKEFVGGLTEVRPVNLLPVPAGILFGPPAALGCAIGNLVIDIFYDYEEAIWIGFLGNFLMAYIPYKIWNMLAGRKLHVHSVKRLLLFIGAAFMGCLTCSWALSYGMALLDRPRDDLFLITFMNNMIFTLSLGMSIYIVVTSEKLKTGFPYEEMSIIPDVFKIRERKDYKKIGSILVAADAVVLLLIFIGSINDLHIDNSLLMRITAILATLTTLGLCFFPLRKAA